MNSLFTDAVARAGARAHFPGRLPRRRPSIRQSILSAFLLAFAGIHMPAVAADDRMAPPGSGEHHTHGYGAEMRLVEALRRGGLVVVVRHGLTDAAQLEDLKPIDTRHCFGQRMLSAAGRQLSTETGTLIARLGIPVGSAVASPMCRTVQTAELMFSRATPDEGLMGTRGIDPATRLAHLKRIVKQNAKAGTNVAVVAHYQLPLEVFGTRIDEGDMLVLRPESDELVSLGVIPAARWGDIFRESQRALVTR